MLVFVFLLIKKKIIFLTEIVLPEVKRVFPPSYGTLFLTILKV